MGFLGYDPGRLRRLRGALDDLTDDARRWSTNDHVINSELASARRATNALAAWATRIDEILISAFDSPYTPLPRPPGQLVSVVPPKLAAARSRNWSMVHDPLGVAESASARAVVAFAAKLLATPIDRLLDDAPLRAHVVAEFDKIAADPAAVETFFDGIGPDGFARLVAGLATETRDPTTQRAHAADAILAKLGALIGVGATANTVDADGLVDAVSARQPYAALRLLPFLSLASERLGDAIARVWARVEPSPIGYPSVDEVAAPGQPTSGDLIVDELAREPEATKRAVMAMDDTSYTKLLRDADGDRLGRVLAMMTSPELRRKPWSSPIVGRVLATLDRHRALRTRELTAWVGAMAGPWLPELVPETDATDSGYPVVALDLEGRRPDRILSWIGANADSANAVQQWMGALAQTESSRILATEPYPRAQLEHLGVILGSAQEAISKSRVDAAAHRIWVFRRVLQQVSILASSFSAGAVQSFVVSEIDNFVIDWVGTYSINHHSFGLQPVDEVEDAEVATAMPLQVAAMAALAHSAYIHEIDGNDPSRLAIDKPPPRPIASTVSDDAAYMTALDRWRRSLPAAQQVAAERVVDAVGAENQGFRGPFNYRKVRR